MKRAELLRYLEKQGCLFFREGTRHTIFHHPTTRKTSSISRHRELSNQIVRKICKDLGVPHPWKT